jgi:hypothetical protein
LGFETKLRNNLPMKKDSADKEKPVYEQRKFNNQKHNEVEQKSNRAFDCFDVFPNPELSFLTNSFLKPR